VDNILNKGLIDLINLSISLSQLTSISSIGAISQLIKDIVVFFLEKYTLFGVRTS
jgi:hypothetical protein